MRSFLQLLLAALLLTVGVVNCDTCVSQPATLPAGADCRGGLNCQRGYYCDVTSVCSPLAAPGGSCDTTYNLPMCPTGTTCKGPKGGQMCIVNANAGSPCVFNNLTSYTPQCGNSLQCDGFTNRCISGNLGDSCYNSTDCANSYNCTNGVCTGTPDYAVCIVNTCGPNSYCPSTAGVNVCTPKIAVGGICQSSTLANIPCVAGAYCVGTLPTDTTLVCVANQTRTPGSYCGTYDDLCQGSRKCQNSYCAQSSPNVCNPGVSSGNCAPNQVCQCDGIVNAAGYGNCGNDPCYQKKFDYNTCLSSICGFTVGSQEKSQLTYAGSCLVLNCKAQSDAYYACSDAFKLIPNLFFIITFFAFFVPSFAKTF